MCRLNLLKAAVSVTVLAAPLILMLPASKAQAQFCENTLCPSDETYRYGGEDKDGPYGVCQSSGFLGYRSHYLARCDDGWTLNPDRGECIRDVCSGDACGAQVPLCRPDERYEPGGTDANGAYGVCHHGPARFTRARSHRLAYCREGWTLLTETGACRRDCEPQQPAARPDLVIDRLALKSISGEPLDRVRQGTSYLLCFVVRNRGEARGGSFVVRGGGLGIPTNPEQSQAPLGRGQSRDGCLFYPVTPRAGVYSVGVTVDANGEVTESREDNNDRATKIEIY